VQYFCDGAGKLECDEDAKFCVSSLCAVCTTCRNEKKEFSRMTLTHQLRAKKDQTRASDTFYKSSHDDDDDDDDDARTIVARCTTNSVAMSHQ
jgi:hypothetical protein